MISRPLAAAVLGLTGLGLVACGDVASAIKKTKSSSRQAVPQAADAASSRSGPTDNQTRPREEPTVHRAAARAKPLAGKVIAIDPGHNGGNWRNPTQINKLVNVLTHRKACDTTGTSTNTGYSEAAFTWDVAVRLAKLLKARGATIRLTRTGNSGVGPCITERAAIGNRAKADAAISIHADGAPATGRGFHVILPKKINGPVDPVVADSQRLGQAIRDAFRRGTGLPYSTYLGRNALDFRSDLGGLNLSTVPKVFIECGNMRNPQDAARFTDPRFRQRIAGALAAGLQDYLTRR